MSFLMRSILKDKTKSSTPKANANHSMADIKINRRGSNLSLCDFQPNLDNSFSSFAEHHLKQNKTPPEVFQPIPKQTHISSILNRPTKTSLMQDLYLIFQDYVSNQQDDNLESTDHLLIGKVEVTDFDAYTTNLQKPYSVYKKNNEVRLRRLKQKNTDEQENLMKCYQRVPNEYWTEDFYFDFTIFNKTKEEFYDRQENVNGYLDLVEINLHSQITEKFQEFLDVIMKINQMEAQVENALYEIKFLRILNANIKEKSADKVVALTAMRRRKKNFEDTLQMLNMLQLAFKLSQKCDDKSQDLELKAKFVKAMQASNKNSLNQITLLKSVTSMSNKITKKVQEQFTFDFQDKCLQYLKVTLKYEKVHRPRSIIDLSAVEDAPLETSYVDTQTSIDDFEDDSSIPWTLTGTKIIPEDEEKIKNLVMEYIGIGTFPPEDFKNKLFGLVSQFYEQFAKEMNEYVQGLDIYNKQKEREVFTLKIKSAFFYLTLLQQFIFRFLSLNDKILRGLIRIYIEKFTKTNKNMTSEEQQAHEKEGSALLVTIQSFYSLLGSVIELFCDKTVDILSLFNAKILSVRQFSKLSILFEETIKIFNVDLKSHEQLICNSNFDDEKTKIQLLQFPSIFNSKSALNQMEDLKLGYEREFILHYHSEQTNIIKKLIQEEQWSPAIIPYTFAKVLDFFFDSKNKTKKIFQSLDTDDSQDASLIEQDISSDDSESSTLGNETKFEEDKKEVYDIKRQTLSIFGQNFKITPTILQLFKIIYDYFSIGSRFKAIETEIISKVFNIVEVYNNTCYQVLLEESIDDAEKSKKFKAKNLALSLNSLVLLENLMDVFLQKITNGMQSSDLGWLSLEFSKVKRNISNHVNDLYSKIHNVLETKLIQQCNDLEKIDWSSTEKMNIPSRYSANILHNTRQFYRTIEEHLLHGYLIALFNTIIMDIKQNYLRVFEEAAIEDGLAAKRICEELTYFCDDIYQVPVFQLEDVNFASFKQGVTSIKEDRCGNLLLVE